jgi:hypothetical protein
MPRQPFHEVAFFFKFLDRYTKIRLFFLSFKNVGFNRFQEITIINPRNDGVKMDD